MPDLSRRGFLIGLASTALTPALPRIGTVEPAALPGCWDGVNISSTGKAAYWFPTLHTDWFYGWDQAALVDWQRDTLGLQSTVYYVESALGNAAQVGEPA